MKKFGKVSLLLIFISFGFTGCDDTENPQVKGVLLDVNNQEPVPNEWVVINSILDIKATHVTNNSAKIEYIDPKKDSTLTNSEGVFVFDVGKGRKYYTLEMGDKTLISTFKHSFTQLPFSKVHYGYDTLLAGARTSVIIHVTDENINDGKTLSVEVSYQAPPFSTFFPIPDIFRTPEELSSYSGELKLFWDYNHEVSISKKITENGVVQNTEPETIILEKGGTKIIDVKY